MTAGGRPLRFLGVVLGGWVAVRVVMLWPAGVPDVATEAWAEETSVRTDVPPAAPRQTPGPGPVTATARVASRTTGTMPAVSANEPPRRLPPPGPTAVATDVAVAATMRGDPPPPTSHPAIAAQPDVGTKTGSRWSGAAYAIVRQGGGAGAPLAAPQLGGSQVGARVAYALDAAGRVALTARAAGALAVRQKEAALGIEWQPFAAPVRLIAERRIGIENVRGGIGAGIAGGTAVALGRGARAEGYAQAGYIARTTASEGYVDAAVQAAAPAARWGRAGGALELGVGAWGAAQRGARRIDAGPIAALVVPAGGRPVRLTLSWRQRLAGNARPGSGPALAIGRDF